MAERANLMAGQSALIERLGALKIAHEVAVNQNTALKKENTALKRAEQSVLELNVHLSQQEVRLQMELLAAKG